MRLNALPPLDALKGFVATARRGSITAAADELCLTQSAVSRQIQSLEQRLGAPLFVRGKRGIALTAAGEGLYAIAAPMLAQLADFAGALRAAPPSNPVTIAAGIGVAALWILPRLGAFQALHPGVDVRLAAGNALSDLEREGIDLAIRYCDAAQAPPGALHLFDEIVVPIASPALAARAFASPAAVLEHTLLELDDAPRTWLHWPAWLRARGIRRKPPRRLHFNQYDQVVQAALEGHGVALGRLALVEPMLSAGRLAAQHEEARRVPGRGYWLLAGPDAGRPDAAVFRAWLLDELAQSRARIEEYGAPDA